MRWNKGNGFMECPVSRKRRLSVTCLKIHRSLDITAIFIEGKYLRKKEVSKEVSNINLLRLFYK